MPTTRTPLLDCDEIRADVLRRIVRREPRLERLARRQLARLTPDRWTVEWHLPTWLGRRLDRDPRFVEDLTRANVLGLLSIRLQDDLEDGEVPLPDAAGSRDLARLAYEMAVSEYRAWFNEESPVWTFLEGSMAVWRVAAAGANDGAGPNLAAGADLAARGAPMKIAGFACCLHAGRLDLWPALEQSLDGAVRALVLYDQFCDWEADLAAGRWNAFVATMVDRQGRGLHVRNRSAVLIAMLARDVVRAHFERAVREATEAAAFADRLEVIDLARFLRSWAGRTSRQGTELADHYRSVGTLATRQMFGTRMEAIRMEGAKG